MGVWLCSESGDVCDVEITDYHWEIIMTKQGVPAIHSGKNLSENLNELNSSHDEFTRTIGTFIDAYHQRNTHRHSGINLADWTSL